MTLRLTFSCLATLAAMTASLTLASANDTEAYAAKIRQAIAEVTDKPITQALESVLFNPTPIAGQRLIEISVNDGLLTSALDPGSHSIIDVIV